MQDHGTGLFKDLDNPIYGTSPLSEEETAGGENAIYGLPDEFLCDTAEGVEGTHYTSNDTAEATYDVLGLYTP